MTDYIADFVGDSSIAHSKIEAYIDYGDGKSSVVSEFDCSTECLKGRYEGNFDIRNSRYEEGQFEVCFELIKIHLSFISLFLFLSWIFFLKGCLKCYRLRPRCIDNLQCDAW